MVINGQSLLDAAPIRDMIPTKEKAFGLSHGLSEVGYDIRIKQTVTWTPPDPYHAMVLFEQRADLIKTHTPSEFYERLNRAFFGYTEVIDGNNIKTKIGRSAIASSIEHFAIPKNLWCEFRNKSTLARCFVDATLGTDGEPNWNGWLTIEILFHDNTPLEITAGSGILKAVFHKLAVEGSYDGKYQNQPNEPVAAIFR
jgi:dCTP deaminase